MSLLEIDKRLDGTEELLNSEYCSKISMMSETMAEDIYILILQYFVKNCKGEKNNILEAKEFPFNGKLLTKDGKGLNFKVSQIPEELQRIIVRYLKTVSN